MVFFRASVLAFVSPFSVLRIKIGNFIILYFVESVQIYYVLNAYFKHSYATMQIKTDK